MGHHITAMISFDRVDADAARALDLPAIAGDGVSIVPLDPHHTDH